MERNAIGIFDSGVGGLSVFREVRKRLPDEDLLYVADSGHAPYGDRSGEFIRARSETIVEFFLDQGTKAIVIACNTASAVAVQALRSRFPVAIVAIEPAVKPAIGITRSGVIGILATRQTVESEKLARLMNQFGTGVRILVQPCPGLAELVERGELSGAATEALVSQYVTPLIEQGADTIVLGCTHYPFLAETIRKIAGPEVNVLDPAAAVARQLHHRLETAQLLSSKPKVGTERFWTSGDPARVRSVIAQLWGKDVPMLSLPTEFASIA